jgi:hypothetical protein
MTLKSLMRKLKQFRVNWLCCEKNFGFSKMSDPDPEVHQNDTDPQHCINPRECKEAEFTTGLTSLKCIK